MSLVNEYLQKTQQDSPTRVHNGAVPPILTGSGSKGGSRKTWLKAAYLAALVGVVAIIAFVGAPYLRQGLSPTESGDSGQKMAAVTATKEQPAQPQVPAAAQPLQAATAGLEPVSKAEPAAVKAEPVQPPAKAPVAEKPVVQAPRVVTVPEVAAVIKSTQAQEAARSPEPQGSGIAETDLSAGVSYAKPAPVSQPVAAYADQGNAAGSFAEPYNPSAVSISSGTAGGVAKNTAKKGSGDSGGARAVQGRKQDASYYYQLGLVAQKDGNTVAAEKYYQECLRQDSRHVPALTNLSMAYLNEGRYEQARQVLRQARAVEPRNPKVLVNLGNLELKLQQYDQAKMYFQEALKVDPRDRAVLTNLAYLAQVSGNIAEMGSYYRRLLDVSPNNVDAILAYASVLEKSGKYTEAVSYYRRSLQLGEVNRNTQLSSQIRGRIRILSRYVDGASASGAAVGQ